MNLNYFCSIIIDYLNYENENLDSRNEVEWLTPSQTLNLPLPEDHGPFKHLDLRSPKQLKPSAPPACLKRSSLLIFAGPSLRWVPK
jgi:hypothetical protein